MIAIKQDCLIFHLPELFSEPPDAESHQDNGENRQDQKVGPKLRKAAAFDKDAARDQSEMPQRVQPGDRLQPAGHGLDGSQRSR